MIACERCGAAFAEDDLDVLCPSCREHLWAELAAALVGSRGRSLAAEHWARRAWWRRARAVKPWRAAS